MHRPISESSLVDPLKFEADGQEAIRNLIAIQPAWAKGAISSHDARFLSGLLLQLRPKTIVEIGVASGWSGAVMLESLRNQVDLKIHGIDLSPTFYLDRDRPTGSVIAEVLPTEMGRYKLHSGSLSFELMPDVGRVDFGFIDAHHMHPWATLDMIALLPFLEAGAWVAMHDINLCRIPRHLHKNRGPFYLFHSWPDARLHSSPELPMIGAVEVKRDPKAYLSFLIELLYTPWEVPLSPSAIKSFNSFVGRYLGPTTLGEIERATATMNPVAKAPT